MYMGIWGESISIQIAIFCKSEIYGWFCADGSPFRDSDVIFTVYCDDDLGLFLNFKSICGLVLLPVVKLAAVILIFIHFNTI